ncbi:DUF4430 domain-containing protein [Pontibacillus salipaludis]|uniref:Transcobalamin-like C-terminal domain-containing protein n=1 Tax=Pontibacillus salipaludis TaxID=1697394 RepID=A0ABQ1PNA6_9BACI|nr:DUF4430 domain-containing protein [Pontibacillus salipaludis]GGC99898.1 hypothetical protein GCM10011389_03980 [Pontibacillus salipaludis]
MKQMMKMLMATIFVLGGLAACGQSTEDANSGENNQSTQEQQEQLVTVEITTNNGEEAIAEREIEIEDGATVMEVMKANFNIETGSNGGFITSIEGVAPKDGEQKAWFYSVNGEEAMVGAKEYTLEPGDTVSFDFHSWE